MDKAKRITGIDDSQGTDGTPRRRHPAVTACVNDHRPTHQARSPNGSPLSIIVPVPALPRRAPAPSRSYGAAAAGSSHYVRLQPWTRSCRRVERFAERRAE